MNKNVVIIGSGFGGLSTGIVLAKNGYHVTVLEKGAQIGGCLQCFKRKGVKFETGMHFVGSADKGQILDKILTYLEVQDKIKLSRLDVSRYNVISLKGQQFCFANGKDAFIDQMSEYFPSQRDNLIKYCDLSYKLSTASALRSLKYGGIENILNSEYQLRSIDDVIDEIITDELLRNVLVGDMPLYAAERGKTPFATHAFIMNFYNQSAFRFVGGSDTLVEAMADTFTRYGGEILSNSKVSRIVCDETQALGVEINGERFIKADYVISAIHPQRTIELLGNTKLIRPVFRNRIKEMPQTTGVFSVYLHFKENTVPYMNYNFFGYNCGSPWGCERYDSVSWPKCYLYMHFCDCNQQRYAKAGVVLSYMNFAECLRWKDTEISKRGKDYEDFMNHKALLLIRSLSNQFPGLQNNISAFYTSSPLTYRDYTGTERGSIYGIAKDVSLGSAGRVPHKTRIPNLFMAGQNINSHGILGVFVGTMVTCGELIPSYTIYEQILEANQ